MIKWQVSVCSLILKNMMGFQVPEVSEIKDKKIIVVTIRGDWLVNGYVTRVHPVSSAWARRHRVSATLDQQGLKCLAQQRLKRVDELNDQDLCPFLLQTVCATQPISWTPSMLVWKAVFYPEDTNKSRALLSALHHCSNVSYEWDLLTCLFHWDVK